jgi:peptidoglycan DL-endopeptidase CwlO
VQTTQAEIARLKSRTDALQTALNTRANSMYRDDSPVAVISMLLGARSFEEFNSVVEILTRVSEQDASNVSQLKQAREQAAKARDVLVAAQTDAGVQQASMAANAQAVRDHIAASSKVLAGINSDIKTLIAQQQAAEAAAARARYLAWAASQASASGSSSGGSSGSSSGGTAIDTGGNPPTSSKGALAVWWAEKALGRPYQWAAAGPDSFDCSGLVMWAYGHAGISLPHYSGAQFTSGSHVSRAHLQPGDLVFFGSPIHHVGMYVGGGDFIEAPHTGANVRIASLSNRDDYAGATRP